MWKQICIPSVADYSLKVYRFASAPFKMIMSLLEKKLIFSTFRLDKLFFHHDESWTWRKIKRGRMLWRYWRSQRAYNQVSFWINIEIKDQYWEALGLKISSGNVRVDQFWLRTLLTFIYLRSVESVATFVA